MLFMSKKELEDLSKSSQEIQKELREKKSSYNDRLSGSELFQASRYQILKYTCFGMTLFSAMTLTVIEDRMRLPSFILGISLFSSFLFFGLAVIFHAKEGMIRQYFMGSSRGTYNSVFGQHALRAGKIYLFAGWSIVIATIGLPLLAIGLVYFLT